MRSAPAKEAAGNQAQLWQLSGTTVPTHETPTSLDGSGWMLRHG